MQNMLPKKASYIYQPVNARNCPSISWFVIFTCLLSRLLIFLSTTNFTAAGFEVAFTATSDTETSETPSVRRSEQRYNCVGKYIKILDIPSEFNTDLLKNCSILSPWIKMCKFIVNNGLGHRLEVSDNSVFSDSSWFTTDQFTLEMIFHSRMKQYRCLTDDSSKASAIYVPYYAGLDVGRYLWNLNATLRDATSVKFSEYVTRKPEWKRMEGRDHFFVIGRISGDFSRNSENTSDASGWGNHLLDLPGMKNMTKLVIEANPKSNSEIGIPYPTFFHPSTEFQVQSWQDKMKKKHRPYLFSFAGAPRPKLKESIRNHLIKQCQSAKNCQFLNCNPEVTDCGKPEPVMKLFQSSKFCLQPPGDSYTRKSLFDTIIAGCIPIILHPASAYVQYLWHLPKDYSTYSVFTPMDEVKNGSLNIEKTLLEIPKEKVKAMRKEVIKLIPKIVYANPSSNKDGLEDAFEVTLKGVLDRVSKFRKEMEEGRKKSTFESAPQGLAWKYNYFGDLKHNEWDKYFDGSFGIN